MRVAWLALALCAGGESAGPPAQVRVHTFQFSQASLAVPAGTEVDWLNGDAIEHTVTSGVPDSAAGDWLTAYGKLREAAAHMQMIADPLAGAIAKQFPEKFAMK
jgi:plastocyanin